MSAAEGAMSAPRYAPHPYVGGRTAALRALAAWRMCWPGAPRVIALTGNPGSGRSRLLTGFLMMCDPEHRKKLPLYDLDPATVPPDLPAPAVPGPAGRTAAQVLELLADHFGLDAARSEDIFTELAALEEPVSIVVPDVDRAGPVRAADEPARLVADVLKPLAALKTVQLLADVPRALAAELADALPSGQAQIIDLDAAEWADPEGLVRHAETALGDAAGAAPELPYTTDPVARRALAEAMAGRADGSHLTVRLGVQSLLTAPDGFDPADASLLPGSIGEALDLHARRLGSDPQTLRSVLTPLAFAEGAGLPARLLAPLASAVAGRDMSREVAEGMLLAAPFIEPVADTADEADVEDVSGSGDGPAADRPLLRLIHPAIADDIRSGLPDPQDAQARIAMALLEAVPEQDWSRADPYVRDHLAAHTLEAGLLPQLLTDPGLFAHADPVVLRAAVEAVPLEQLGAPARTYLRTAPLLTRSQAPVVMRAALLETAFVEDGLGPHADALHTLGLGLPWRTLWSVPLAGVAAVTTGLLPPEGEGADARPVAAFLVPEGTPGSRPRPGGGKGALLLHDLLRAGHVDADPARVQRPSQEAAEAAPYGFSPGADSLRVWDRPSREVVTVVLSDTPFTGADLSPDGVLVLATGLGVTARQILATVPGGGPHHGAG